MRSGVATFDVALFFPGATLRQLICVLSSSGPCKRSFLFVHVLRPGLATKHAAKQNKFAVMWMPEKVTCCCDPTAVDAREKKQCCDPTAVDAGEKDIVAILPLWMLEKKTLCDPPLPQLAVGPISNSPNVCLRGDLHIPSVCFCLIHTQKGQADDDSMSLSTASRQTCAVFSGRRWRA